MTTTSNHDADFQALHARLSRAYTADFSNRAINKLIYATELGHLSAAELPDLHDQDLLDWWNSTGRADQFEAAMNAAAVQVACPSWCVDPHRTALRPDSEEVFHNAVILETPAVRVELQQRHTVDGAEPVEVSVVVLDDPQIEAMFFTDPVELRALGAALPAAADQLAAAQAGSR